MNTPPVPSLPLVVQHNALVNARFSMSALEMKFFVALLSRIGREDEGFRVCEVPVKEICSTSTSKAAYNEVREMVRSIGTRALFIEALSEDGKRMKSPDVLTLPLMGHAYYRRNAGIVEASFNENLRPYLLELKDNFTKAQLGQLLKLRSPASQRIYWLLREYASFGYRIMGLLELRNVLGLTTEYVNRFDHFRERVLDRAQDELDQTDLPFTYEVIKQGRTVTQIKFTFNGTSSTPAISEWTSTGWEAALLAIGVGENSLPQIKTKLEAGEYQEGYIHFVLHCVREKVAAGKIKKEAGAVYKALTEGYMLPEYHKQLAKVQAKQQKVKPATKPLAVMHSLQEAQAAYETMRKKGKALATFEENLQVVYLNQGFELVENEQGKWLVKK